MPGRPKRNRRKEQNEKKKVGKLSKRGRIMTCKLCGQTGHNKKGCAKQGQGQEGAASTCTHQSSASGVQKEKQKQKGKARADEGSAKEKEKQKGKARANTNTEKRTTRRASMQGYGLYINANNGMTILNPGRPSTRFISSGENNRKSKRQRIEGSTNQESSACIRSTQGSVNLG